MPSHILYDTLQSSNGLFPLVVDSDLKGGFRVVADQTALLGIASAKLTTGMWVFRVDNLKVYRYNGGSTGTVSDWTEISFGSPFNQNLNTTDSVTFANVSGNGSGLTNLNATNISSGTVSPARLGTGTADNTTYLRGDGVWAIVPPSHIQNTDTGTTAISFQIDTGNSGPRIKNIAGVLTVRNSADTANAALTASAFVGDGSGLTGLTKSQVGLSNVQNIDTTNAANISSGILPGARFDDTTHGNRSGGTLHAVATTTVAGFMSATDKATLNNVAAGGVNPFNQSLNTTDNVVFNTITGNGSALTGLTKTQVGLGNVQNVDTTNAANITSGILSPARMGTGTADSTTYLRGDGTWQTVPINHTQNTDTGTTATSFQIDTGNSGPRIKNISGVLTVRNAADTTNSNLTAAAITGTTFTGDGSALTGLTKGQVGLGNVANVDTTNAANISSGVLPAGRFDDTTHGNRSGGTLHAVATTSVAGFMSSADKTSLGTVAAASHTQNTDTGTTATSFQIDTGNTGPRIKNISGIMTVRNAADSANAALTASAFVGDGSGLTGLTKAQVGLGNVTNVDTTNAANISSGILPAARFDDTTHGNRSGGTLHAVATTSVAGFMSAADKTSLGTVAAASHAQNTDTGTTATSFQIDTGNTGPKIKNVAGIITIRNAADSANAALTALAFTGDGSALTGLTKGQVGLGNVANVDTTNAANISSGILPAGRFDDTTHGNRSGGTLHAVASHTVAGFMSASDKTTLDNIVASGVNPFDQSLNTTDAVNFAGLNVDGDTTTDNLNINGQISFGGGNVIHATQLGIELDPAGNQVSVGGTLFVSYEVTASSYFGDGSNLTGLTKAQVNLGNVANVDTTNAANISSGILPAGRFNDTTHGNRSGGTLHALATESVAGFMSAADKTALDTMISNGVNPFDQDLNTYDDVSFNSVATPSVTLIGPVAPVLNFVGDGTGFTTSTAGIQFDGSKNYFFGIGSNLASPAILVQSNGFVNIPHVGFGYLGTFDDSTFGRTEGAKVAMRFGNVSGDPGIDIFDYAKVYQSIDHGFSPMLNVRGSTNIVGILTTKGAGNGIQIQNADNTTALNIQAEFGGAGSNGPIGFYSQNNRAMAFKNGRVVIDPSSNYTDNGVQALQVNGGIKAGPSEFGDGSGYTYISNLIAYEGVRIQPGSHSAYAISSQEYGTLKYQNNFGGQQFVGGDSINTNVSSGIFKFLEAIPEFKQSGTAGYIAFDINPTETTVGSGTKLLQRWAANNTQKASIDNGGNLILGGNLVAIGSITGSYLNGDGSAITGLTKAQVGLGNVQNVDTTNASNITSGTLGTARMGTGTANSTTYLRGDGTWQTVPINHTQNTDTGTTATSFQIDTGNSGPRIKNVSGVITIRNAADSANAALTASAFVGDGSGLTGLTKGQVGLGNVANVDTTNAANISSGILPAGRFDDSTHGNRSGGTLHAVATTSVAGFMSAADKTALNNYVSTSGNPFNQSLNTTDNVHFHDVSMLGALNISSAVSTNFLTLTDSTNNGSVSFYFSNPIGSAGDLHISNSGARTFFDNYETIFSALRASSIQPYTSTDLVLMARGGQRGVLKTDNLNIEALTWQANQPVKITKYSSSIAALSVDGRTLLNGATDDTTTALQVNGGITSSSIKIATGTVNPINVNYTGPSSDSVINVSYLGTQVAFIRASGEYWGQSSTIVGNVQAGYFLGNGAGITSLNASNLASGTLPAARFDDTSHGSRSGGTLHAAATTSVAGFMSADDKMALDQIVLAGANPFDQDLNTTDSVTFENVNISSDLQVAGTIISSDLQTRNSVFHIVDSSSSPIATFNDPGSGIPAVEINGDISASGAFIADNGVVLNSDFDSNYIRFSSGTENGVEVAGTDFVHLRTNNNANGLTVDLTGTVTAEADLVVAGTISGDGSGLTGLTKAQIGLSNVQNVDTTNAANISSGILPGARFDDTTHGSRSGGTLHAVATTTVAGFMSAADKIALNTYIANSGNPFDQNLNTTNDVHFNSVTTTHDLNVGGNIVGVNAALSTAMTIGGVTYKNNGGLGTNTAITGQLGIVQKSTSPLLQLFSQGRLLGAANLLEFYNQDSSVGTYFDSQGQFYTSAYRFIGSSAQIYSPNGDGSIRINPSNGLQIDTGGVQTSINSQLIQHTTSATDSLGGGGYQVNFANNVTDTRWSALEVKSQGTTTFRVHPQGWSSQTGNSNVGGILTAGSLVGSGSGITSINAGNISSGTVSSARLGSGTANSTTYLRGDNTWQTIPNSHVQNTDTGTTATSFQIDSGNTGPRIKNISGVLTIRNAADSANAALTASAFTGDGSALTGITAAQVGALSLSGGTVNGVVSINGDFHYNSGNFFLATDRLNFANTAIFAASSTDVTLSSYSGGSGGTSVAQGFNNLSTGTKGRVQG